MIKRIHKKIIIMVLSAGLAVGGSLSVLHYYHVPTWLCTNVPVYAKQMQLTLWPITISDSDLFQALNNEPSTGPFVPGSREQEGREGAWEAYRRLRAAHFSSTLIVDPPALAGQLQAIAEKHPRELRALLSHADEYAADRFAPFGTEPLTLGRDFTWTSFPSRDNDVIYVWEVNTLQHLPLLAQAYLFTGQDHYVAAIARHLSSWNAENPIDNSVNWRAAMEVSLRLYSLVWTGELLVHDPAAANLFPELTKTIYGHAQYVAQRLDAPRRKNNHGIFSALGLYFFAVNYPEFRESKEWRSFAEQRILDELALQYTRDGIHKEFAPTYHKALLDGYLHYLVAKRKLNEPVPAEVRDQVRAQARYLQEITGPDSRVFLIGDSDDHHFLRLDTAGYADAGSTLKTGALLFVDPGLAEGANATEWGSVWLLGHGLYEELAATLRANGSGQPTMRRSLTVHRDEGIFRVDASDLVLFGGYSRLGAEPQFSGHNHCSITSFLLWNASQPVAIDPGTYTYRCALRSEQVVWRDFLRSSQAHNVTTVDGQSQAEPLGDFGYHSLPDARLLFADRMGDFFMIAGEHHAYQARAGKTVRIFVVNGRSVVVIDWFPDSTGTHDFESNLVFGTDHVSLQNNMATLDSGGSLYWSANKEGRAQLAIGSVATPAGWRSASYGTLTRTAQFRGNSTITGPAVSALLFDLSSGSKTLHVPVRLIVQDLKNGAFCVVVRSSDDPMIILLNPRSASPVRYKEWTTDARVAALELQRNGRAMLFQGTYLHGPDGMPRVRLIPALSTN